MLGLERVYESIWFGQVVRLGLVLGLRLILVLAF